jgi:ElaB/YqjD/DUF883 family membrane-anchored ribosome-binding protein
MISSRMAVPVRRFTVLVYRMPPKPTAARVAVWRSLKKIGAIYLQQSVCVFPDNSQLRKDLAPILRRINEASGEFHLLPLRTLDSTEGPKLIEQFQQQTANHYAEIIENCEVNFTKEIEFEMFRKNFTYEEAEEIRAEFEKICAWYERVLRRDWFGAPNQAQAKDWLNRCEKMLEEFEAAVFERQEQIGTQRAERVVNRRRRRRPRLIIGSAGGSPATAG